MNRDIKFRALNRRNKWVYGTGIVQTERNTYDTDEWEMVQKVNYDELDGYMPLYETEDIKIETLGQYTGLKDKNSVEIYEGDIILIGEQRKKVTVVFQDGRFGYVTNRTCIPFQYQQPEVIGNIYEEI